MHSAAHEVPHGCVDQPMALNQGQALKLSRNNNGRKVPASASFLQFGALEVVFMEVGFILELKHGGRQGRRDPILEDARGGTLIGLIVRGYGEVSASLRRWGLSIASSWDLLPGSRP